MPQNSLPRRIVLILAGVAVLGFLAWGLVKAFEPRVLPLQAQMEAQEVNVSSKVPGRVGQVHVRAGQSVKAGEVLFELDSPEVSAKLLQARSAQAAAQAVSAKASAGARPEEVEMARLNWERAQTGARIAQTTAQRVQGMFDEGVIARQKRDEADAQWRAAEQQAQAAHAQYEMARKGARPEDKQAAQAQANQVGGVVAEAEVALAETRIRAPIAAEVSKVQIQPGELAPQGFPVVTLVNLQDSWAVLQVREDAMSAYAMGTMHVGHLPALKRDVQFKVSSVAVLPDFATWRAARPGGTDLRTFEVRLRPLAAVPELRPGMSVSFAAP
jgi:HlyD family secretion protein